MLEGIGDVGDFIRTKISELLPTSLESLEFHCCGDWGAFEGKALAPCSLILHTEIAVDNH